MRPVQDDSLMLEYALNDPLEKMVVRSWLQAERVKGDIKGKNNFGMSFIKYFFQGSRKENKAEETLMRRARQCLTFYQ